MLQFLLGTSGSGKTTLLRKRAAQAVADGRDAIFLVPEQFSFETEKALYESLGAQAALHVEVLSFTRLCNRIFREYGSLAGEYIGPGAKLLLMSLALDELRDTLSCYAKKMHSAGFVEQLVAQVSEFKNAGVSPQMLLDAAGGGDTLGGKLRELSSVYGVYQAFLERSYRDAEDDLTRACGFLECETFFDRYDVFIDAFKDFTAAELMLLRHVVEQAPRVTVALCADTLEERESGLGLFSPVRRTAARLTRMAKEADVPVEEPVVLTENRRARHPELIHLERGIFRAAGEPYAGQGGAVTVVSAPDPYAEAEYVAATVCELVRTRGLRYREIAVIGRDLSAYRQAVESAFSRFEVPFFMDARADISDQPLTAAVLYALEAVRPRSGLDTDAVLALLKTAMLPARRTHVSELENYCYVWEVAGAMWTRPFTGAPSGYGAPRTGDEELLARLEALRLRVATPLLVLQEAVRECDGEGFARAVFRYLEQSGIVAALRLGAAAEAGGETPPDGAPRLPAGALEACAQLYDALVDALDDFSVSLRGTRLSQQRFTELLRLVLLSIDLGELPNTLDEVMVGTADRVRVGAPRVVFLLGANEGMFPMAYKPGGLFTDAERERLAALGLELADMAESRALGETYYAYMAVCSASEALYVCHARAELRGRTLYPSSIVKGVRAALPLCASVDTSCEDRALFVRNTRTAFDEFCRLVRVDNAFTASLRVYLSEHGEGERVQRLLHPRRPEELRLADAGVIAALYGRDIAVSPSKLDQFHRCKMAYFCRYALGVRPRRRAELSPLESGSAVHFVLQQLLSNRTVEELAALDDAALEQELSALLLLYIEENMGGAQDKTARFHYLFSRLRDTLFRLVRHLAREFQAGDFRPVAFELPIRREGAGGVPPVELPLENGGSVCVEGVVDRVDLLEKNGEKYLRVVDYKTGAKEFSLTDVYYGLNLQMLVYLFTIQRNGNGALGGTTPAGVLYMPAKTLYAALDRRATDDEAARKQDGALRMNGLLLRNLEALSGMERDGSGTFLPVTLKVKDNGDGTGETDIKGPVATLEQFGRLEQRVYELVGGMARTLFAGDIAALPTYTKNSGNTCEYCDYRAVCGREENGARFEPDELRDSEVFERLEETDGE